MDEVDYESLPPSSTMLTHMLAGGAAGIMEHTIMYPVDCVKVCIVNHKITRQHSKLNYEKVPRWSHLLYE